MSLRAPSKITAEGRYFASTYYLYYTSQYDKHC